MFGPADARAQRASRRERRPVAESEAPGVTLDTTRLDRSRLGAAGPARRPARAVRFAPRCLLDPAEGPFDIQPPRDWAADLKLSRTMPPRNHGARGATSVGVLILGGVLLQAVAGLGLIVVSLAKAAAWGWGPVMATHEGRWPVARKLLVGGAILLTLAVLQAAAIVAYVYVAVAISYAQ